MSNQLQNILDEIKVEKDSKLLPENIKKGISLLGVEGDFKERVKLFETEEQMQADETAEEGDLAVVYREEVQNWDGTSAISSLTFPETVVLPNKMTGSCYGYASGDVYIDIDGSVSAKSASFRIMGDNYYNISYTSTDGLTYTRTDTYDDTIILANEPTNMRMYDFSEVCGYFMQVGGNVFDGLYNYETKVNTDYAIFARNFYLEEDDNSTLHFESTNLYIKDLKDYIVNTILSDVDFSIGNFVVVKSGDNQFTLYTDNSQYTSSEDCVNSGIRSNYDTDQTTYITRYNNNSTNSKTCHKFVIDTTNWVYEHTTQTLEQYANGDDISNLWVTSINVTENITDNVYIYLHSSANSSQSSYIGYTFETAKVLDWYIAPTQLTLNYSNELLPGKIAYGKNGVMTGDNSVYDNLDKEEMFIKTLGLPKQLDDSRFRVYDITNKPSVIGNYSAYTATYVKETQDKQNAQYKIGITSEYYTLQDITDITGEFYDNGYIARMAKTGKFGAVVKTIENQYKLLVINSDFTEIEKTIDVTATYINVSNSNRAMMLTITESDTVYKYAIFNVNLGTLVTYTTHTSNISYTTKLMEDYAVCTVNKETFIIDLNTDSVTRVGSMEYNWMTTRVFEFEDFFYVIVLINDGTKTEKLYKYNKTNSALSLQASYTGGPFSSNTTGVEILGKTCVESTNYILDYATGLLFRKENTSSKNTLFFCKRRLPNGTVLTGTSKWCGNNIINQGVNVYELADTQNIVFDDINAGTPVYNLTVNTIVKTMDNMMAITSEYNSETNKYENAEYSFNYTNVFKLDTIDEFECCDFSTYSRFKIKYFNDDLTNADYMLLRTGFVEENYGFGSYIKLFPLAANTISPEEYDTAINTVDEILGEEV